MSNVRVTQHDVAWLYAALERERCWDPMRQSLMA